MKSDPGTGRFFLMANFQWRMKEWRTANFLGRDVTIKAEQCLVTKLNPTHLPFINSPFFHSPSAIITFAISSPTIHRFSFFSLPFIAYIHCSFNVL
jgi:hypothetical protein